MIKVPYFLWSDLFQKHNLLSRIQACAKSHSDLRKALHHIVLVTLTMHVAWTAIIVVLLTQISVKFSNLIYSKFGLFEENNARFVLETIHTSAWFWPFLGPSTYLDMSAYLVLKIRKKLPFFWPHPLGWRNIWIVSWLA